MYQPRKPRFMSVCNLFFRFENVTIIVHDTPNSFHSSFWLLHTCTLFITRPLHTVYRQATAHLHTVYRQATAHLHTVYRQATAHCLSPGYCTLAHCLSPGHCTLFIARLLHTWTLFIARPLHTVYRQNVKFSFHSICLHNNNMANFSTPHCSI